MDARLWHVHRVAERNPHIARSRTGGERLSGGHAEFVEHDVTHERAAEPTKLTLNGEGKLRVLHAPQRNLRERELERIAVAIGVRRPSEVGRCGDFL